MKSILTIILSFLLVVSGLAQTRNVVVNTNGAVVQPTNFWSADVTNARSGLGLGSAATNPASAFQSSSSVLSNLASSNGVNITNVQLTSIVGWSALTNTNAATSLLGFTTNGQVVANTGTNVLTFGNLAIDGNGFANGEITRGPVTIDLEEQRFVGAWDFETAIGFETTNVAAATRTNLGIPLAALTNTSTSSFRSAVGLGATWLTNTNVTNFRNAIGLGAEDEPSFVVVNANLTGSASSAKTLTVHDDVSPVVLQYGNPDWYIYDNTNFRSALGLGWEALTNSNAGTRLVSVDSNGSVVSPTNFWQVAPIQTLVQDFTGITASQTNNATNARNVYVYSLATNVSGISNTIILPTNTSTFNGDEVTVIHKGTTNTTTVVRQAGSTNNLITINKFDESIKFIRELGQWDFYHNISFVEPIRFSGTNTSVNAAASRTNLGLGAANEVTFNQVNIGIANYASDSIVYDGFEVVGWSTNLFLSSVPISFVNTTNAATTRTNLGLPLAALTNTSVTNFQKAIFYTNTAPSNIGGNLGTIAAWIEIVASNGVTYKIPAYTNVP